MNRRCYIFSGGQRDSLEFLKSLDYSDSDIICCDAGYLAASELGLDITCIIGDFDTLGYVPDEKCRVITFAKEKDDTDTVLAAREAVSRGYDEVIILNALGGRYDHVFANIQTLAFISKSIPNVRILSEITEIYILSDNSLTINKNGKDIISVFSYSDCCEGVSIRKTKYTLENGSLSSGYPIGACNEFLNDTADISVKKGTLLIILSKDMNLF